MKIIEFRETRKASCRICNKTKIDKMIVITFGYNNKVFICQNCAIDLKENIESLNLSKEIEKQDEISEDLSDL